MKKLTITFLTVIVSAIAGWVVIFGSNILDWGANAEEYKAEVKEIKEQHEEDYDSYEKQMTAQMIFNERISALSELSERRLMRVEEKLMEGS